MESCQPGSSWGISLQGLVQKETNGCVTMKEIHWYLHLLFLAPPTSVLVHQRGKRCTSKCLRSLILHSGRETALRSPLNIEGLVRFGDRENWLIFIRLRQQDPALWRWELRSLRMGRLFSLDLSFLVGGEFMHGVETGPSLCITPTSQYAFRRETLWEHSRWWNPWAVAREQNVCLNSQYSQEVSPNTGRSNKGSTTDQCWPSSLCPTSP